MTEQEEIAHLREENAELRSMHAQSQVTISVLTDKVELLLSVIEKQGVKKGSNYVKA